MKKYPNDNRGKGMTYFDVRDAKQSLISMIRGLTDCLRRTKVYADEYLAYERYIRGYSQHQKKD